ncbi:amino acid adenylation domain-containing protein [Micromonospora sp. NPDC023956]|uniref:non-ribosomal peptide synthetase n=1 Tax=Micromonospora sp. NPDC023956 TaxID=3155722 RepID=UPI0033E4FAB9
MTNLGTAQDELIRRLLSRKVDDGANWSIPRVAPGTPVALTAAQARIWFLARLYPASAEYNIFDTVHLRTAPEQERLAVALRTLVERHDALRVRITDTGGAPVQIDEGPFDPEVTWYDLTGLDPVEADRRAEVIANRCARELIRPDERPLFRFSAIRLPAGGAVLVMVVHHLITDNWSWTILLRELTTVLSGGTLPPAGRVGYLDYAAWQGSTVDERRLAREVGYWTAKLGGELPVLDLPKDRPRPAVSSRLGHALPVAVPTGTADAARQLADREGTTLFVVMLAAYKVMLLRLTGQRDLIVGTALAGRDHPVTEDLVGCFVKAVALRTALLPTGTFRDVVRDVHRTVLEAQDHQALPYDEIVARLGVPRDLGVHPVFQTYFGMQTAEELHLPGAEIVPFSLFDYGAAKWDLTFSLTESSNGLDGMVECAADLFDRDTLDRFRQVWLQVLAAVTADPDAPVGRVPLVSPAEADRILGELNPYRRPEHRYRTLAEPFEEQVRRTPDAVALEGPEGELTYAGLNARANRLAHFLRRQGVDAHSRVALCLARGFTMVTAIYAVAKSGAAYVPLDPEHPDARLAFMLADTAPTVVLTDRACRDRVPAGSWQVVTLDVEADRWADEPASDVTAVRPPGHASHLLYTSGSTGRPKAVVCPVDGAVADLLWMQRRYPYRAGDAGLFKTSYGFDVSLWEVFWPLYAGARLVVAPPEAHRDVHQLAALIDRYRVTTVYLIPTLLQVFLDELPEGAGRSLRYVLSGGEPVTPRLRDSCHARLDADLVNGYGPTETGCATDMVVPREPGAPVVPLGRPAENFRLYVLGEHLDVLPIGVPGEAYLAAEVGLAHGYHRRADLTAERFLPDPYGPPGARMYRTGDICRYRPDGVLEHLGRIGRQVKVRGMRIELAEVESVLAEHDGVDECSVLAVDQPGRSGLVAFVVPAPGTGADAAELRRHAARLLPAHMVPDWIVAVDGIPVSVNGKTDHAALLRGWSGPSGAETAGRALVPPTGATEVTLAGVFAEVLGRTEVGATDNFFECGGHSLLIFKLIAACGRLLGVRPAVADVFAAPTVRQLAERITTAGPRQSSLVPLAPHPGHPVVVLVHGSGGSALPFRELAAAFGDEFSVYALESPDPDLPGYAVEELARRYVAEVDPVRGLSPVGVVGWSMGGCVALEMTRQWRERGVDVAATVLLDTAPPPAAVASPVARERVRRSIAELDVFAAEGIDASDVGDLSGEFDRLRRAVEANRRAYLAYEPAPLDEPVHLLRARDGDGDRRELLPAGDHWGDLLPGLVTEQVPGSHFSLLRGAHAGPLAVTVARIVTAGMTFEEI